MEGGFVKANSNSHHQAVTFLLSVTIILSSLVSVAAQSNPQRIRFARGHSSTTISSRIAGFDTSERLSESGDYLIRVFMMRSAARRKGAVASYTLSVAIH